jgi:hypothetical protein
MGGGVSGVDWRGITGVDVVDAFPTRRGVHTYRRVHGFDWLATDRYARCSRTVCLGDGAMQGGQTFEVDVQTRGCEKSQ